ncbi:MAG: DUF3800 domain-containing protein [Planctomycetota bacterium]|jgi:hypothetical protein
MLHVYCDESGGAHGQDRLFVVTAIAITANAARRVIKRFRRTTRWRGEVKGTLMDDQQQQQFMEQLASLAVADHVLTVVCDRDTALGGWAACTMKEYDIYAELLYEARWGLLSTTPTCAGISVDGGRYNGTTEKRIAADSNGRLQPVIGLPRGQRIVSFHHSHDVKGIQVADVIANFVTRHFRASVKSHRVSPISVVDGLALVVKHVSMTDLRPEYIPEPVYP